MDQKGAAAEGSSRNVSRIRPVGDNWVAGRPEVPRSTIVKLIIFTVAMFALPISTYYWVLNNVFEGKPDVGEHETPRQANVRFCADSVRLRDVSLHHALAESFLSLVSQHVVVRSCRSPHGQRGRHCLRDYGVLGASTVRTIAGEEKRLEDTALKDSLSSVEVLDLLVFSS